MIAPMLPSHARAAAALVASVGVAGGVELLKPEALAAALWTMGEEYERLSRYVAGEMLEAGKDDATGHTGGPSEPEPVQLEKVRHLSGHIVHAKRQGEAASMCGQDFTPNWLYLANDHEVTCGLCARFLEHEEGRA